MAKTKTNYLLKDGDKVLLKQPARVDGYWYDPLYAPFGCWDSHYILPGSVGTVVRARTPCVRARVGDSLYFANVDIPHCGGVSRIRVSHGFLRRIKCS